jgi:hypothetical protein
MVKVLNLGAVVQHTQQILENTFLWKTRRCNGHFTDSTKKIACEGFHFYLISERNLHLTKSMQTYKILSLMFCVILALSR